MINDYLLNRKNLICLFVLIDSRHNLQAIDDDFMQWLAENQIPFSIIFTKTDKLSKNNLAKNLKDFKKRCLKIGVNYQIFYFHQHIKKKD